MKMFRKNQEVKNCKDISSDHDAPQNILELECPQLNIPRLRKREY